MIYKSIQNHTPARDPNSWYVGPYAFPTPQLLSTPTHTISLKTPNTNQLSLYIHYFFRKQFSSYKYLTRWTILKSATLKTRINVVTYHPKFENETPFTYIMEPRGKKKLLFLSCSKLTRLGIFGGNIEQTTIQNTRWDQSQNPTYFFFFFWCVILIFLVLLIYKIM